MVTVLDAVTRWCMIALCALLPIFIIPVSWISIPQAKILLLCALSLIALASWFVARLIEGTLWVPRNILLWVSALLPLAYVASAFVVGAPWTSFVSTSGVQDTVAVVGLWYALLALVAFGFNGKGSPVHLLRALLIGVLALSLFQIMKLVAPALFSLGGYLSGDSSSIFGSWHDLGILCGLFVFLCLMLWNTAVAQGPLWRSVTALTGLGSLALLFVINSVDVWYTLAAISVAFGIIRFVHLFRDGRELSLILRGIAGWVVLALLAGAAGYWSVTVFNVLPTPFQIVQIEVRPSWQGTFEISQKVLSSPKALIFGSGPNTFTRAWGLFKPPGVNQTDFWNVDFNAGIGFIPTTLVTTGLLGLLAWITALLVLLWRCILFAGSTGGVRALRAGALGGGVFLSIFHVFFVPSVSASALLFLLLGIVVVVESVVDGKEGIRISLRPHGGLAIARFIVVVLAAVALFLAPLSLLRALGSDIAVQRASAIYSETGSVEEAAHMVQVAVRIFPKNENAHRAAVEVGLLQLSELIKQNPQEGEARIALQQKLEETIAHGLSAVSIDSADYQNWLSLAALYQNLAGAGIEGAYENARSAYEKTIAENPTNPLPHVRIAQIALAQKDNPTALAHLNTAISLKPNFGPAYYLRSQIHANEGNIPQAIDDAMNAVNFSPNNAVALYNLGVILYSANSFDLASQALEKAVSIENNYADAIFVLALSWDRIGRSQDALRAMEVVANLNPNDAGIAEILQNLRAGNPALSGISKDSSPRR